MTVLASFVLAVGCLGVVATPSEAATKPPAVSPAAPMAGESTKVTGAVPTKVERPVTLQRKTPSGWTKQASGRTSAKGRYSLSTTFAVGSTIRVMVKKVMIKGKQYADGSVVVFQSVATDIVTGDTNATSDVFVFVD